MDTTEALGWIAALLMLVSFASRDQRCLRVFAVCANVGFLAYGALAGLPPVLALHAVLLPINALRLFESERDTGRT